MNEIKNSNYYVAEIQAKDARDIVKKYHYSGKVVPNSSLHLGIFLHDNTLVGCLQFGTPMNKLSTPLKISTSSCMLELNRMVMDDTQPRNSESQAIGLCVKWVKNNRKDVDWLLSFSDGKQGNVGYIYQATNWDYIGYLLSDSFYDLDGLIMHNVSVWHKYKEKHKDRDTKTTNEILCDNFENVSVITSKQHVYVMKLRNNVIIKHTTKDYPKKDKEVCILKRKTLKENGIVLEKPLSTFYTDEVLTCVFKGTPNAK
jgi:hypothetical protein